MNARVRHAGTALAIIACALAPTGCHGEPPALGPRPVLGAMVPYRTPGVVTFETRFGLRVWFVERHAVPVVAATLVVRAGAALDPPGKGGLAYITSEMLDEGAGAFDALELAAAFDDRGAEFENSVSLDGARLELRALKQHFAGAFDALGTLVTAPHLDAKDWERVANEWQNDLRMRDDEPDRVARVVMRAVLYGPDSPYGAPADGRLYSASHVTLDDVRAFYATHYVPSMATLVVAGDLDRAAVEAAVDHAFGAWKPGAPEPAPALGAPLASRPRFVLVDRKEAAQAVITVVRDGVRVTDPDAAPLELVNIALGGSFTSRLNQNLRETHHYTYGAGSRFSETVGVGAFVASAPVETPATAPALGEMLGEIANMKAHGLGEDELRKVRARDLRDLIETNESVAGVASRLGTLALLGLPNDFDVQASARRQQASRESLAGLAARYLDLAHATVVVVGPADEVLPALRASKLGLPEPELWAPDGRPLGAAPVTPPDPPAPPPKAP